MKLLSFAIILGAALIAGAILLSNRYTLERASDLFAWRLNKITGETRFCIFAAKRRECVNVPNAPRLYSDEQLGFAPKK
jgi:hypothetical protein